MRSGARLSKILFLFCLLTLVLILFIAEFILHRRNLAAIPIRIHVNGTRGKSSTTRLLVAALNHAGIRTFGKTTGTLPRMIFPDGREYPVFRPGGHASVLEQLRIIAVARAHGAQAVVIECMALQPRLQWLSEQKLIRATHGVITNARKDHLDVMGPTERDVALALAGMIPPGQKLFTCERRNLDVFLESCRDRGCTLYAVDAREIQAVSDADLEGFSYTEHKENVALALKVCESLGIDRTTAIQGMWKAVPDQGALKVFEVLFFGGRRLLFVNGFAANDPESTEQIWRWALERYNDVERRIAVFNCREDRIQRSQQLARAYMGWPKADSVLLMGTGTFFFAREAEKLGADAISFLQLEGADSSKVFENIVSRSGRSAVIVGMGNIAGAGLELVRFFENRSELTAAGSGRRGSGVCNG